MKYSRRLLVLKLVGHDLDPSCLQSLSADDNTHAGKERNIKLDIIFGQLMIYKSKEEGKDQDSIQ